MAEKLRQQIKQNLSLHETEGLLRAWVFQNHNNWTEEALDVMEEILIERLGELPDREMLLEEYRKMEPDPLTKFRWDLARTFHFTDEDLVENRQGRLTTSQFRTHLSDWATGAFFVVPLGLVGFLGGPLLLIRKGIEFFSLMTPQDLKNFWPEFYQFGDELGFFGLFLLLASLIFYVGFLSFLTYFGYSMLKTSIEGALDIFRRELNAIEGRLSLVVLDDPKGPEYAYCFGKKTFLFDRKTALSFENKPFRLYVLPITQKILSIEIF